MTSQEYWAKREAAQLRHNITDEKEYDKQIARIYSDMLDACQSDINAFYGKYAAKEGITIAEAKKRVSELDIAAYERKAKRYVKDKDFSAKANEEMRLYNAAMKINRLEMLKANIGLELISGHDELEKFMSGILQDRTEDELKRQAGILGETIKTNAAKAHAIVNASFHSGTFSDRIWQYQDLMREDLAKVLTDGLIRGKNPRAIARDMRKVFYGGDPKKVGGYRYCIERLMRTELARVQTEAQKQSFERNGFEQYTFIVNGGCCDICEGLKGKIFPVAKMMPGENAPPMHPHCRCSTAAYSDRKEYEEWLDFLDKGGTTEEFEKLKKAKVNTLLTKQAKKDDIIKPNMESAEMKALDAGLKRSNVEYKEVKKHKKPLKEDEIIKDLAGGDLTKGSCASLGLAYIGQKGGLNVLDFRDGASRDFFSTTFNLETISRLPGVKTTRETAKSAVTACNKLLKSVEVGKEYYFVGGRHAAIVRKQEDGKYQYLELQSAARSGWTNFDGNPRYTFSHRFGDYRMGGFDVEAFMIDVDSFKDSDDLRYLLGYINTSEDKQRKGQYGTIK